MKIFSITLLLLQYSVSAVPVPPAEVELAERVRSIFNQHNPAIVNRLNLEGPRTVEAAALNPVRIPEAEEEVAELVVHLKREPLRSAEALLRNIERDPALARILMIEASRDRALLRALKQAASSNKILRRVLERALTAIRREVAAAAALGRILERLARNLLYDASRDLALAQSIQRASSIDKNLSRVLKEAIAAIRAEGLNHAAAAA